MPQLQLIPHSEASDENPASPQPQLSSIASSNVFVPALPAEDRVPAQVVPTRLAQDETPERGGSTYLRYLIVRSRLSSIKDCSWVHRR